MPDAGGAFVLLPVAAHRVVVDAAHFEDVQDAALAIGPRRDLAELMGVRWEASPQAHVGRRALRLSRDGSWLVAGDQVIVRQIAAEAFRPLPRWLESLRERLAIVSLVELESGFGFRLDVDRLPPWEAETSAGRAEEAL